MLGWANRLLQRLAGLARSCNFDASVMGGRSNDHSPAVDAVIDRSEHRRMLICWGRPVKTFAIHSYLKANSSRITISECFRRDHCSAVLVCMGRRLEEYVNSVRID